MFDNPLQKALEDKQNNASETTATTTEVQEKKKEKLIQKEAVETGSVRIYSS